MGSISQMLGYIAAQTTLNRNPKQVRLTVDDQTVTLTGA